MSCALVPVPVTSSPPHGWLTSWPNTVGWMSCALVPVPVTSSPPHG